jgi:hypothetical protein
LAFSSIHDLTGTAGFAAQQANIAKAEHAAKLARVVFAIVCATVELRKQWGNLPGAARLK